MNAYLISILSFIFTTQLFAQTPTTIFVTEKGGKAIYNGRSVMTESFLTGIKKARSGEHVIVLPGTYHGKYTIAKQADPNNPITISGVKGLTTFACGDLPENHGKAALKFSGAMGLVLSDIRFNECWPTAIEVVDSTHLTFSDIEITGGHSPFKLAEQTTYAIKISNNHWQQDTTGNELWSTNPATLSKGAKLKDYQGSFVTLHGILGSIIVESNTIAHSFGVLHCLVEGKPNHNVKNIILKNNTTSHIRGSFLHNNCTASNLVLDRNTLESFGNFIRNDGHLKHMAIRDNRIHGDGGSVPNHIFFQNGSIKRLKFHSNDIQGVSHFFAKGSDGTYAEISLVGNSMTFKEDKPNWRDIEAFKKSTIAHNVISPAVFKDQSTQSPGMPKPGPSSKRQQIPWATLNQVNESYLLAFEHIDLELRLIFSRPPLTSKPFKINGYELGSETATELNCAFSGSLEVTCKLPHSRLQRYSVNETWLQDNAVILWPSNRTFSAHSPKSKK